MEHMQPENINNRRKELGESLKQINESQETNLDALNTSLSQIKDFKKMLINFLNDTNLAANEQSDQKTLMTEYQTEYKKIIADKKSRIDNAESQIIELRKNLDDSRKKIIENIRSLIIKEFNTKLLIKFSHPRIDYEEFGTIEQQKLFGMESLGENINVSTNQLLLHIMMVETVQ